MSHSLNVALAQCSSILLNREATLEKVLDRMQEAAKQDCDLICFGESLVPGYPFWLSYTGAAKFNDRIQKEIHARYIEEAVCIERGDLMEVQASAKTNKLAVYLGIIERPLDRGGHSLYCSLVYINKEGEIQSVHRKLQPTYEERLSWSPGDGHGLVTHALAPFCVGGLNCWENWMPLSRAALYGQGENLHVAVWPGAVRNTEDLTRVLAKEGRSYCISVSGVLAKADIPEDFPHRDLFLKAVPDIIADGGSCISAPDGSWVIPPQTRGETLVVATLDIRRVWEERQNFDPSGHYSRPDVTRLVVDRSRQSLVSFPKSPKSLNST